MLTANLLIHQYGDGAEEYTSKEIRKLRQKGNQKGAARWRSVLEAMGEVRKIRNDIRTTNERTASDWAQDAAGLAAHLGQRIRLVRIARGLSRRELGNALGVSAQQIQKYETGTDTMPLHRLLAFASRYAVPLESLWGHGAPVDSIPSSGADDGVIQLVRAYKRIGSSALRRRLLHLVKEMAGDDGSDTSS